jgi:hypothetical protein
LCLSPIWLSPQLNAILVFLNSPHGRMQPRSHSTNRETKLPWITLESSSKLLATAIMAVSHYTPVCLGVSCRRICTLEWYTTNALGTWYQTSIKCEQLGL